MPVCNVDLAYTEEHWGDVKDVKGDGHVGRIMYDGMWVDMGRHVGRHG